MVTLSFRFPAGHYHATPWGHHVNEGLVEWPPSPWRLVRALLSTGYTACHWSESNLPHAAASLIEKLCGVLPSYSLPAAAAAHTRHYMPLAKLTKGREDTTLVFDAFADLNGDLRVHWPVELLKEELDLLRELMRVMPYLGRAESWVVGSVDEADVAGAVVACRDGELRGPGWEQVTLPAPVSAQEYQRWRSTAAPPELEVKGTAAEKKRIEKANAATRERYPASILHCLQMETGVLRSHGWSQAPGSRRVNYWRPTTALEAGAPRQKFSRPRASDVEFMLLALAPPNGNAHALPSVTRTLPLAEKIHQGMVSIADGFLGQVPPSLSGHDESGAPLKGQHGHSHVLPVDLDGDGHLDHVIIWARDGLNGDAQAAIRRVRKTYSKKMDAIPLAVVGAGNAVLLARLSGAWGQAAGRVVGTSRAWVSATPFVAPRYLKEKGRNTLEGQLQAELESRGLPPARVELIAPRAEGLLSQRAVHFRHFVRVRAKFPPPMNAGFCARLTFERPVQGPLCLGYAGHFGLGRFETADDKAGAP